MTSKIMVSVLQQSLAWGTYPCGHSHRPPRAGSPGHSQVTLANFDVLPFFPPQFQARALGGKRSSWRKQEVGSHSPFRWYLIGPVNYLHLYPPKPAPLEFFTHDTQYLRGEASKDEEKPWRSRMCSCTHLAPFWNSFFFPLIQRLLVKVR